MNQLAGEATGMVIDFLFECIERKKAKRGKGEGVFMMVFIYLAHKDWQRMSKWCLCHWWPRIRTSLRLIHSPHGSKGILNEWRGRLGSIGGEGRKGVRNDEMGAEKHVGKSRDGGRNRGRRRR